MKSVTWRWTILLVVLATLIIVACGDGTQAVNPITLAPESVLPPDLREAPPEVREAYRFALANPGLLSAIPCYCGCGAQGHRSNLDCYIKEVGPDGTVVFESHAALCSICIDITRDVRRLHREGKSVAEIKAYIDRTYSRYGPSNMP